MKQGRGTGRSLVEPSRSMVADRQIWLIKQVGEGVVGVVEHLREETPIEKILDMSPSVFENLCPLTRFQV